MNRFEGRFTNSALAALSVTGTLVLGELVLRWLAPVPDPYIEQKISRPINQYVRSEFPSHLLLRTEVEPGLPGITGVNSFTTDNLGFRGDSLIRPKPANEYRVFLLGGSTTECFYLDDADALNSVVERALQAGAPPGLVVRVYNAGRSGDRSDDHVSMYVHRVAHLQPDLVVVFAGINDLNASIFGYDFLHLVIRTADGLTRPDTLRGIRMLRVAATELQLARRFFYLGKRVRPAPDTAVLQDIPLRSNYPEGVARRRPGAVTDRAPPSDPDAFRVNLLTIVAAAKAQGADVALLTQQTTWASPTDPGTEEWQWMRYRGGVTYEEVPMRAALEGLNAVTRDVARSQRALLYDLVASLPPTRDYFYDDVHFNVRGADSAGAQLARLILRAGLLGRRAGR